MFIATRVTLDLTSSSMGTVLRIPHKPMLVATVERPGVQSWAFKATSSRGTRQLMVNHFELFSKSYVALHRQTPSIKQSLGQDVPTSSGESSGSSVA
jgi:hypothetical protein